jgi:two-component system, sensor histidine kinase RegB
MSDLSIEQQHHPMRSVRLDTLVRLRWLAVLGQSAAVLVVHDGFDFEVPFWACLAVIAAYGAVNVLLRLRFRWNQRLEPQHAASLLALDIIELAVLLFLTGGLQNPFSFLFAGPVLISAAALPARMTLMLAALAIGCATVLVFIHYPLPWPEEDQLELPPLYMIGVWLSLLLAIGYISIYSWQIIEESRQLSDALVATELVLTREHYLSQLDGLAAAAAHELGTPLSTILVVARELEREVEPGSRHAEDIRLLREQAQRCRVILGKLTELPAPGEPFERMKLSALIEEVIAPHRDVGVEIEVEIPKDDPGEPVGARNPAVLYGLGNILENAVDFANQTVEVNAWWNAETVEIVISDDGPGIAPDMLNRIGEPYLSRRRAADEAQDGRSGLGLGVFIARTLLERTGAKVTFTNRIFPDHGAVVQIVWLRTAFEAGETAPGSAT